MVDIPSLVEHPSPSPERPLSDDVAHPGVVRLLDVARSAAPVSSTTAVVDVDRRFRLDEGQSSVIVSFPDGVGLIMRAAFENVVTGRLGYGRALLTFSGRTVGELVVRRVEVLAAELPLTEVGAEVMGREAGHRLDDLVVDFGDGRLGTVSVARVLEALTQHFAREAMLDPLTGLANRRGLICGIEDQLALQGGDRSIGLAFLDLDRFKVVNDTLGHTAGDELLVRIAERLRAAVRSDDTVARLGGDEFAVLRHGGSDVADLEALARRVLEVLAEPFLIGGIDVRVSASVGLVVGSRSLHSPETLLRDADTAMYQAKHGGRSGWQLFDAERSPAPDATAMIDLTLHRRTEQALQEVQQRFQAMADDQSELLCRHDLDTVVTFANDAYCRFMGRSREDLVGASFLSHLVDEHVDVVRATIVALRGGESVTSETINIVAGNRRHVRWQSRGIFDEAGTMVEVQAVGRDVTDLREVEHALRLSEERLRGLRGLGRRQGSRREDLAADLRRGIAAGELVLHYQPMIDVVSGGVIGAEALVRWRRGDRLLLPAEFIPLAEESDLIVDLGSWVIGEAARQLAAWRDVGGGVPVQTLWVNLSARHLARPELVAEVVGVLDRFGISPAQFGLEVTETVLAVDPDHARDQLTALRSHGVRISLDDFGTGYSSLTYLQHLPFDEVKIDRSFVNGLSHGRSEEAIVAAVIGLGHALDMSVIAEGVEHAHQLERLAALGCDHASGWHIAPAMPPDELIAFTQSNRLPAPEPAGRIPRGGPDGRHLRAIHAG